LRRERDLLLSATEARWHYSVIVTLEGGIGAFVCSAHSGAHHGWLAPRAFYQFDVVKSAFRVQ
jgi:hypothetical protein